MAGEKAPRRPKAETPKGFRDYFGADVAERKAMLDAIASVYHRHGFDPLETSAVETVEALGKFLPDVDRPNEGVFGWQDEDGDWLALRYDLTAPLARVPAPKVDWTWIHPLCCSMMPWTTLRPRPVPSAPLVE